MAQSLLKKHLTFVLITFIGLVGCSPSVLKKQRGEMLEKRVMVYWDLRKRGLYSKSYELEAKEIREGLSLERYVRLFGRMGEIEEVGVSKIEYLDEKWSRAKVTLRYCVKILPIHKRICIKYIDIWKWEDGNWYHYLKLRHKIKKKGGEKARQERGL